VREEEEEATRGSPKTQGNTNRRVVEVEEQIRLESHSFFFSFLFFSFHQALELDCCSSFPAQTHKKDGDAPSSLSGFIGTVCLYVIPNIKPISKSNLINNS
jgi:hypothetical protein